MTTSFIARVIVERVERTDSTQTHGFNGSSPKITTETRVELDSVVRADTAQNIALKVAQSLTLLEGSNVQVS